MSRYHHDLIKKTNAAQHVDKILSKKIMQHLQVFFDKRPNKPRQLTRRKVKSTKTNNVSIYNC